MWEDGWELTELFVPVGVECLSLTPPPFPAPRSPPWMNLLPPPPPPVLYRNEPPSPSPVPATWMSTPHPPSSTAQRAVLPGPGPNPMGRDHGPEAGQSVSQSVS